MQTRILFLLVASAACCLAQEWKVGVAASVITPSLEERMAGYYYPRSAEAVHDDLYAKAIVVENANERAVLISCDTVSISREMTDGLRDRLARELKAPRERILVSATHCHTGPVLTRAFLDFAVRRIGDAAITASRKMQPVRLWAGEETEASLPQYRRYIMKDGSIRTNPGLMNPDVVRPAGQIDPRVGVLYAEEPSGRPVLTWVNYAMHLDTVGGSWISADYPYYLARLLSKVKGDEMMTAFTIGAAGNINHWDVRKPGPQRGQETARRLGETIGAAVLKAYTHLEAVPAGPVRGASSVMELATARITPKDVEEARKVLASPPPQGVDFTLDRVQASKVMGVEKLKGAPVRAEIQVVSIGPVAMVGIPGELFVELGREIRKRSPFPYTNIVELANDGIGYIPTAKAFEEGSYEPTSSRLAPGSGEKMVEKVLEVLQAVRR